MNTGDFAFHFLLVKQVNMYIDDDQITVELGANKRRASHESEHENIHMYIKSSVR